MEVREYTINECLKLLDLYILITKSKEKIFITKSENNIIVFNNNFSTKLTQKDFLDKFKKNTFLIYKELEDTVEIDPEYRKWRQ